jgi:hypothetical protein
MTPRTETTILDETTRWSHPRGNPVVPSSWLTQAAGPSDTVGQVRQLGLAKLALLPALALGIGPGALPPYFVT